VSYLVLARKCRPQTFDELVGQKHVATTLAHAIESGKLAHAYIFAGLRGTGKTTVARIVAKCLNCERGVSAIPCGVCASCVEIADSRSMDVLEVDAASRTKVEQTRELLEVVSFAPVRDRNKILIIDEAHMLSKASFNALLKTLEEPPPNVMFILATTELQKVLPTIVSRCQVFEFRRVATRELSDYLRQICDTEGITISAVALERVARAGEGSVRDSLSVLERVVAFCGQQVEDEDVLRMLGGVRAEVLSGMVSAIAARDAGAMLRLLDGLVDEGHDLLHFWNETISALRDLLLLRSLPDAGPLLGRSEEEAADLARAAGDLSVEDLTRVFQVLADLEFQLKGSAQPRFMFEAALIRVAGLGAVRPIEELLGRLGRAPSAAAPAPDPPRAQKKKAALTEGGAEPEPPPADLRSAIVAAVLEAKPMIGTILGQASRVDLDGSTATFDFTGVGPALVRPLQSAESLSLIRECTARHVGRPVEVRLRVEGGTVRARGEERNATPEPTAAREPTGGLLDRATRDPGVRKLLRDFRAQVVEITPLEAGPVAIDNGPTEETG